MIDKCIREIKRERQGLQTQETKRIVGIKKIAKQRQMALLRSWLKTLSDHDTRLRSSTTLKYQLQAVSLRIQVVPHKYIAPVSASGMKRSREEVNIKAWKNH
nr:vacuolar protein sorting-associated protein 2 homolog 1 [Tanacetum cinerariifolium]